MPNGRASAVVVSLESAEVFLARRFGSAIGEVSLAGRGEWSDAYAFRHDAGESVVRFSAFDEDFRKDVLAARFATPLLPIPVIVEIGETGAGYYAISERVPGRYLDDLDGNGMRALLPALFAALDAMRTADVCGGSGYGVWLADGNAPHPSWRAALLDIATDGAHLWKHGWRARLENSATGAGPFDAAYERLQALIGLCPEERRLIHSDLLHSNVLVEDGRISGVIDWGCAMYGDFLYDLAWFCYWAPWYPAWRGIDFAGEARRHYAAIGLDVPNFAARLACYQIYIGLAAQAFNAYMERWDALAETAARTLEAAQASP